jgi:hypothetical protein
MRGTADQPPRLRPIAIGVGVAALLVAGVAFEAVRTRPIRQAVAAYTDLLVAANRQDLDAVRRICSARYLATHTLKPAAEGGVVGLPRNIHKNFQAWRHGPDVWVCPTNRTGPIFQFVREGDRWRFDGPVGILRGRGQVVRYEDMPEAEAGPEGETP